MTTTSAGREGPGRLAGIAEILPKALPAMKAKLYASLGVRLEYDQLLKRIRASAEAQ
jgi:hypothetical protein